MSMHQRALRVTSKTKWYFLFINSFHFCYSTRSTFQCIRIYIFSLQKHLRFYTIEQKNSANYETVLCRYTASPLILNYCTCNISKIEFCLKHAEYFTPLYAESIHLLLQHELSILTIFIVIQNYQIYPSYSRNYICTLVKLNRLTHRRFTGEGRIIDRIVGKLACGCLSINVVPTN